MPRVVALQNEISPETLIIGNGDVKDLAGARVKTEMCGCDGVMLGRGIFGNPWLFTDRRPEAITPQERLEALQKLAQYFDELRPRKSFHILKKHIKAFVTGWPEAAALRGALMNTNSLEEFTHVLAESAV